MGWGEGDDLWLRVTLIQANMETASVFCTDDLCASVCVVSVFFECDVIYESGWPSQQHDVCLQRTRFLLLLIASIRWYLIYSKLVYSIITATT